MSSVSDSTWLRTIEDTHIQTHTVKMDGQREQLRAMRPLRGEGSWQGGERTERERARAVSAATAPLSGEMPKVRTCTHNTEWGIEGQP